MSPRRSARTPWYAGPTLIEHLETVSVDEATAELPFRFPVQYVNRPNLDFRGFAGTIASGSIAPGDEVVVAKSGKAVARQAHRHPGRRPRRRPSPARPSRSCWTTRSRSRAATCWFRRPRGRRSPTSSPPTSSGSTSSALLPGRSYILRTETDQASATVTDLKYRINVNDFAHEAAKSLEMNEVGVCNISTRSADRLRQPLPRTAPPAPSS